MAVTRILHAPAGDPGAALRYAGHPAVDAVEVDTWVRRQQPTVMPARRLLGRVPLPARRLPDGAEPTLVDLLQVLEGRGDLVIALQPEGGDPAADVARALHRVPHHSTVRARCSEWEVADRLQAWLPEARVAYTVRTERELRRYITERMAGARDERPLFVHHSLLHSPQEVEAVRAWAGWVGAFAVDDTARARDLAVWRVDALSSSYLTVLVAV